MCQIDNSIQEKDDYPGIGQCYKALLPPKLDRQHSLPLERLPCLWSWFPLRRSRCSRTTLTNPQLCSQLNTTLSKEEIIK